MIIRAEGDSLIVTKQIDHAGVSGLLASYWGNGEFPRPLPFESVVYACGAHDEAWRHLDEEPVLDQATGWPHTFMSMDLPVILPAYLDGADRVGRHDPYAGYLVMMHYQGFFNRRFGLDKDLPSRTIKKEEEASVKAYMASAEMLRGQLRSKAWEDKREMAGDASCPIISHSYLILQIVDVISLFLCLNPAQTWSLGDVRRTIGGPLATMKMSPSGPHRVRVQPWPFATREGIEVTFPIRRIPNRRYSSTEEVRNTLRHADISSVSFRIVSD
jgi:hypothetical protein